jgi:hypothetical protein
MMVSLWLCLLYWFYLVGLGVISWTLSILLQLVDFGEGMYYIYDPLISRNYSRDKLMLLVAISLYFWID